MNTNDILRQFITTRLIPEGKNVHLSDSDSLINAGIIDSLGILTLMSFIEEKFSMEVQGDDLVPENFDSIKSISALVEKRSSLATVV